MTVRSLEEFLMIRRDLHVPSAIVRQLVPLVTSSLRDEVPALRLRLRQSLDSPLDFFGGLLVSTHPESDVAFSLESSRGVNFAFPILLQEELCRKT